MKSKRKPAFSADLFGGRIETVTLEEWKRLREADGVHVVQPQRRQTSSDD